MIFLRCIIGVGLAVAAAGSPVVLVTGATGRTGSLVYTLLKKRGVTVRALVRSQDKARKYLNCTKCDPSEGIFVGDVTEERSLDDAMRGTTALVIGASAVAHCGQDGCAYPKGGYPIDVDFNGGKAQIEAFAKHGAGSKGNVVLCSSMGTTVPDSFLDKFGHGQILFYKLNEEAFLMSSGIPFTIVKPCGLVNDAPSEKELVVGHDDDMHLNPATVTRGDVARVMVEAVLKPDEASGLRFDLCSKSGTPTADVGKVFEAARFPWQQRSLGVLTA
jgi:nucleoside-diphosphate-sugar epimerase|eukprot:TRINITY_DN251_c0_g1_i1.p1 TRINITY_DN251_c0_g1~~TRINITY_DN251_c0_g1_i1.p1  ORF type:complete len:274 (-),score=36.16 TRINITY_DN251_c0_g1_i1:132-953(-)